MKRFWAALHATYGWQPPIERTKNNNFSLALFVLALGFFLARLFWLTQLFKLLARWLGGSGRDVPPLIQETYIFSCAILAMAICVLLQRDPLLRANDSITIVLLICVWKVFETITANLYYLLLRPVFAKSPPHNLYRSFVLASVGLVEVWLTISIGWFFAGATNKPLSSMVTALYFVATTFFTVGYGDFYPVDDASRLLAIASMFSAFVMIVIVLGRAVTLLHPLAATAEKPLEMPSQKPK